MAHGKETPRQKMIGMMYLVLMALLALNVSREVLEAFVLVDESLTKTTEGFYAKNDVYYKEFDRAAAENPVKAGPWKAKAYEVRSKSDVLHDYIQELKFEIVRSSEGDDTEAIEGKQIHGKLIGGKDDTFKAAEIMIGANKDGKANDLRIAIEEYREYLLSLIDEKAIETRESIESSLNTDDPPPEPGAKTEMIRWQDQHFEDLPLIAVITLMSKMQSDVRNAESDAIRYLYSQIEAGSFNFNLLESVVIPNSNYIVRGNDYSADIFMAAFDTTQRPVVYIGEYDSTITDEGIIDYQMKGELGQQYDTVPIVGGKGVYTVKTSSVTTGWKKWEGIISLKRLDGTFTNKPFRREYQVADPSFVVSPTAMNVFYLAVDNPVEISVPGTPSDRIIPSTNNGRITPSGRGYIVSPTRLGTSEITVSVRSEGGTRSLGSKSFRVREVPDPTAKLAGQTSGSLAKNDILAEIGPLATMPEWFEFDIEYKIISFMLSTTIQGFSSALESKSGSFTTEQRDLLRKMNPGVKFYVEDITAVGPDGKPRKLNTLAFRIK